MKTAGQHLVEVFVLRSRILLGPHCVGGGGGLPVRMTPNGNESLSCVVEDGPAHSNLTGVSPGNCHWLTRHFFITGQQVGPSRLSRSTWKNTQKLGEDIFEHFQQTNQNRQKIVLNQSKNKSLIFVNSCTVFSLRLWSKSFTGPPPFREQFFKRPKGSWENAFGPLKNQ